MEDYLYSPMAGSVSPAVARRRRLHPDGPTSVAEGQEWFQRVARAEIIGTYYRSPLELDNLTGETAEMRLAYRQLMLKEPAVKAALISKIETVAALDPQVLPSNPDSPVDNAAAKWVDWSIQNSIGGWPKVIETIGLPALIDGFSVGEKIFDIASSDVYGGFWTLKKLYSCDTRWIRYDVDVYKEIQRIRMIRTVPSTPLDPRDFITFVHLQLFESPFGISDLRAAYRAANLIESAIKLRAIMLENFSGPFLTGKYTPGQQNERRDMEKVLAKARSLGWACMPVGSELEVMNLATSSVDQFQQTIDDLRKEIYTAVRGAYLPFTEGSKGAERGDTGIQKTVTEIFEWWLAGSICEAINTQLVPDLVRPNFGGSCGLPRVQLGGMNLERAMKQLELIKNVNELTGDVSKRQIYDLTRVERARDDEDRLPAPQQKGGPGGAPGAPPQLGGGGPGGPGGPPQIGPGAGPAGLAMPSQVSAFAPPGHPKAFSDDSEHPVKFLSSFLGDTVPNADGGTGEAEGWPPAGEIEGAKLAAILEPSVKAVGKLISQTTKDAISRRMPSALDTELWNNTERMAVINALSTIMTLGEMLARARLRQHQPGAIVAKKFTDDSTSPIITASFDLFGKSGDVPFSFLERPVRPLGSAELAVQYITSLVPMPGVDALAEADGWRRRAFTLAVDTEGVILDKVKAAVVEELSQGKPAGPSINAILLAAGLAPKNPQYPEMVARTNAMDAYDTGFADSMRDPKIAADFPAWQYCGLRDGRQGEDHEPHFDKYWPSWVSFKDVRGPRIWNCRCIPRPVYKSKWAKLQYSGKLFEDAPASSMFGDAASPSPIAPRNRLDTLTVVASDLLGEIPAHRLRIILNRLADDGDAFAVAAGLPPAPSMRFHSLYDESKHPRDDHGLWIDKADLASARSNSGKAAELRARVTKPAERAKLDQVLGSSDPISGASAPSDRATGKKAANKLRVGKGTAADQRELFNHLPDLDKSDVQDARNAVEEKPSMRTDEAADINSKVADHVRGVANRELPEAEHPVHEMMRNAIARSTGLTDAQKERYGETMSSVLGTMPTAAKDRIAANLKGVGFHGSVADIGGAAIHSALTRGYLAPGERQRIETYKAAFEKGKLRPGAAYLPKAGKIHLDGDASERYPVSEVYAHCLSHVVDGPQHEISNSPEWQRAWNAELAGKLSEAPKLNRYAQGNPSEGFAEFGRLAFGSEHSAAAIEAKFPLCSAVLKAKGLWQDAPPKSAPEQLPNQSAVSSPTGSTEGGMVSPIEQGNADTLHAPVMPFTPHAPLTPDTAAVTLPDVFGERVGLDHTPNGEHIDALAPSHRKDGTPTAPVNENIYTVPATSLNIDPIRFQYKVAGIGLDGVTNELKSIKNLSQWNPNMAGALLVWRDPKDGKDYVVNGHHRFELASRLGVKKLNVRYIDTKDVYEARAQGALANIAEGRGKAIDAAKYMRDTKRGPEHLKAAGVSMSSKMVQDATALVNLAPKPFQMVTEGRLDEATAVAVAKHCKDPELQDMLFAKIRAREAAGNEWTPREIEVAAKKMAIAGKMRDNGDGGLFGAMTDEKSTFDQEVDLQSYASRKLSQQLTDYTAVGNSERAGRVADAGNTLNLDENSKRRQNAASTQELFDKFQNLKSHTSKLTQQFAKELADQKFTTGKEDVRKRYFDALPAAIAADAANKPIPADTADERSGDASGSGKSETPASGDAGRSSGSDSASSAPPVSPPAAPAKTSSGGGEPHPDSLIVNDIDPTLSPVDKVKALGKMTEENEPVVNKFLKGLDEKFGTKSGSNKKLPDRILSKSQRPSVLAKKPWHDVEHIRDSFRFKTELHDITQLPDIINHLENNLGAKLIKKDVDKFLTPGEWGWRITAFDMKMPNGQLVEYYTPVKELEEAKKEGHKIFEKWRNEDMSKLDPDRLREFEADLVKSRENYQGGFDRYLQRTGQSEDAIRASLNKISASAGGTALNSSDVTDIGKINPPTQTPDANRENAVPSDTTYARPSGASDATAIDAPPGDSGIVSETPPSSNSPVVPESSKDVKEGDTTRKQDPKQAKIPPAPGPTGLEDLSDAEIDSMAEGRSGSRNERKLAAKLKLDDDTNVVGRHIPKELVPATLTRLGVHPSARTYTNDQAFEHLVNNDGIVRLSNNWSVRPVNFGHEKRFELVGPIGMHKAQLEGDGVQVVNHSFRDRYFIPTGPDGASVLQKILHSRNERVSSLD